MSSTASSSSVPTNRHALTAVEKQRSQLEKLLKDPTKPAYIAPPPKEKTIRPPREMMKNVQGSSAGAGSGEFHVYKASRRREYERLKLLEEASLKEVEEAAFERKRRALEEAAEAKTAKNRAKRQKKKERAKGKLSTEDDAGQRQKDDAPIKKRRLVNGKEMVFRKPGDDSEGEELEAGENPMDPRDETPPTNILDKNNIEQGAVGEAVRITIVEDD